MQSKLSRRRAVLAVSGLALSASISHVQAEQGDGSFRLEYQFVKTGEFDSSIGDIDIGETDAHVFMFSGSYALTDRWTLSASLPWIKKRHQGAVPHNPGLDLTEFPEADQSIIDNGDFHSDWQDLYIGASFAAVRGDRWTVSPYLSVGLPTNDYPFYGHAAVGRNLWHIPVGANIRFQPYFSDFAFGADAAYVFTERSLGVDVSHWLVNLNLSYHLTNRLAPHVFLIIKRTTGGLKFPDDFDVTALNDENWYFHDRTIKHNFINGGVGFDWMIAGDYMLSATAMTMLDPDQVNAVDYGISLGVTRFFSRR